MDILYTRQPGKKFNAQENFLDDDRLSQLTSNSLSLFSYQKPVLYAVIKSLMGF